MTRRVEATGRSMLPAVLPGAELVLGLRGTLRVFAGAIVCYIDQGGDVVAHRIIRIEEDGDRTVLLTRGDAQRVLQRVPLCAVSSVVEEVRYGAFRYRTAGPLGRAFARLALGEGFHWETLRRLSRYVTRSLERRIRPQKTVSAAVRGR